MRSNDVVSQLAVYLPRLVDDFTTQVAADSLTRSGTTVTVGAVGHGLSVGQQVNITGALVPINISSLTRSGLIGTLVTDADHDFTENAGFDVQIDGAVESEFNGTFTLLSVPNRRTVTFQMADAGATVATGAPLLLNGSGPLRTYNGLHQITAVPDVDSFQYEVTDTTLFTPASGTIVAKSNPRISAAVDYDSLLNAYTKQDVDEAWAFVVLGDAVADKSRNIDTDSTDNIQTGHFFNQRMIQSISVYVFLPSSTYIGGRQARDRCEELFRPICQSIVGVRFPSLISNDNNPLMVVGHGVQDYNGAFYVHQYTFEATIPMGPDDIFIPTDDVAFRDIDLTMGLDVGTETFNTLIDLDDQPL